MADDPRSTGSTNDSPSGETKAASTEAPPATASAMSPGPWGPPPGPWGPPPWWPAPVIVPPPELLEPGLRHPIARRPTFEVAGRAAPRLYAAGWVLTIAGLGVLIGLVAAAMADIKFGLPPLVGFAVVEATILSLAAGLIAAGAAQMLQRRTDGWQDYFGPSPFLLTAALILLLSAIPMRTILSYLGTDIESAGGSLFGLLLYLVGYVAAVHFLVVRTGALSWHDVVRPRHLAPGRDDVSMGQFGPISDEDRLNATPAGERLIKDVAWALLLLVPVIVATILLLAVLMTMLGLTNHDIAPSSPVPAASGLLDRVYALIAVAVVAPIGEEIFFRGFATNAWARSLKRHRAILQAGLFFAFIHVINVDKGDAGSALRVAVVAFGGRIPVSIALAWLYVRRRSIFASGALHSAYNGTLVILSWLAASAVP